VTIEKPQNSEKQSIGTNKEKIDDEVKKTPVRVYKPPKIKRRLPSKSTIQTANVARLPLNEKIKRIISGAPLISILQIQKQLKDKKYGSVQIGLIKLYRTLKTLNLNTKEKRYRYYRSA